MPEPIEMLERRIDALRARIRQSLLSGDRDLASSLRRELSQAQGAWEVALADLELEATQPARTPATEPPAEPASGPASAQQSTIDDEAQRITLPLREQVHHALTLLTVPAAPKLISAVHDAFYSGPIPGSRLTSIRRDEERSFRLAPFARPYYLCAALTADLLAPARGVLAVSTWPMEARVIGSLSSRVYFLTAAIRVAENVARIPDPGPPATRLLWRFAANIPGGSARRPDRIGTAEPAVVIRAATAELEVHAEADSAARLAAARRARDQLDHADQLFGNRLRNSQNEQHIRPA